MCTADETDVRTELSLTGGLVERIVGETSRNPAGYRERFRLLARALAGGGNLFLCGQDAAHDIYIEGGNN